jgi:hypothetical protein
MNVMKLETFLSYSTFLDKRHETDMENISGHAVLPIQSMADKQGVSS